MIFAFETTGEGKAIAATQRVQQGVDSVKRSYQSVSKELGVMRKAMSMGRSFGFSGGIAGGMLASSLGQMTQEQKDARGPAAEMGSMAGTFLGTSAGAAIADKVIGKSLGKVAGGLLGSMVGPIGSVLGAVVGGYIGDQIGAVAGDMAGDALYKLGFTGGIAPVDIKEREGEQFNAAEFGVGGDVDKKAIDRNFRFWSLLTGDEQRERIRYELGQEAYKRSTDVNKALNDNAQAMAILMRI